MFNSRKIKIRKGSVKVTTEYNVDYVTGEVVSDPSGRYSKGERAIITVRQSDKNKGK